MEKMKLAKKNMSNSIYLFICRKVVSSKSYEMTRVSSNLTKVLGSNSALDMHAATLKLLESLLFIWVKTNIYFNQTKSRFKNQSKLFHIL